jgi:SAM-dependent methyltransferase
MTSRTLAVGSSLLVAPVTTLPAALAEVLACPACGGLFQEASATELRCGGCAQDFAVVDGVPRLLWPLGAITLPGHDFEGLYRSQAEPWNYSERAAETLKRQRTLEVLGQLLPSRDCRVLDVGCSLGHLTVELSRFSDHVYGADLSQIAIEKARARSQGVASPPCFLVASGTALPLRAGTFDAVVVSDGVRSWFVTPESQIAAVAAVYTALKPGGRAVFLDYMNPKHFPAFVRLVRSSPWKTMTVEYLPDRLWYVLESTLKAFRRQRWMRRLFSSLAFARMTRQVSRLFGARGSKHALVVVVKAGASTPDADDAAAILLSRRPLRG